MTRGAFLSKQALQKKELSSREAVLNGIAWDPEEDVLYLTGMMHTPSCDTRQPAYIGSFVCVARWGRLATKVDAPAVVSPTRALTAE